MLREKLLNTSLFVDNTFFQSYVDLIEKNISNNRQKSKTQKHHIFPKCFSKKLNLAVDNSTNNLVNLLYKDHILAHYYLIYATEDADLKNANIHAFNRLLNKQGHWLDEVSLQDLLLKQQIIYEQTSYLRSERSRRINSGGCYVNDGTKSKHIQLTELDTYLAQGWKRGQIQDHSASRGRVVITNGTNEKRVLQKDLATFLDAGWVVGRVTKGRAHPQKPHVVVHSAELNIERHISAEEKETFLANGFKLGGLKRKKPNKKCVNSQAGKATKNKIWIHNGLQTKMILPEDVTEYLTTGWVLGRGKIKNKEE
jgi:hypothetical protein